MIPDDLRDYVAKAREQQMSESEMLKNLREAGWKEEDIQETLRAGVPMDSTYPGHLLGPMELLKAGWARFKSRWQTALIIQVIPGLLMLVPALLFAIMFGAKAGASDANPLAMVNSLFTVGWLVIPTVLAGIFLMYWAQIAQYLLMSSSKKLTWKEAYLESRQYLWQYFALSFIVGLVTTAGFILLIVPGVIISLMLVVAYPVLFSENLKGFQALKRSRWYTQGYKVEILKIVGLFVLFSILLSIVIGMFENVDVLGDILGFALQVVLVPVGAAVVVVLYENLRAVPRKIEESQVGTGLFKGMFVAGLLIVPLMIVAMIATSMYVISQIGAPGNRMPEYQQYLPEDFEPGEGYNEEEFNQQMEELNRMLEENGMSPLPSAQDLPLEESSDTI